MPRKRKLPDGIRERGGVYYSDFYANGRRVRKRLSTDLDAATQILNDLRARADKADFGLLDNDYPLKELRKEFLCHCKQALKPKSAARYEKCLDNILAGLPATRAAQVSPDLVRAYRQARLARQASPRTVNMEVTTLGTMLRWGVKEKKIGSNPLAGLAALPHDHPKEGRALTDDEVKRLLEASPQPWRDIWYAYLVTGMRKNELVSLTFRDIDWDSRELVVRMGTAKNHRERRVPIDARLWEILLRQRDGRASRQPAAGQTPAITARLHARFTREHVFVTKGNTPLDHRSSLWRTFIRCCERAGIVVETPDAEGRVVEHLDLHSLRRTYATNLIANGADPKSVQELLGHRTLDMTMRIYAKIHTQTKRQALGKLSYGAGAVVPDHIVEYPAGAANPVQNGHRTVTGAEDRKAE
jgi:integrase